MYQLHLREKSNYRKMLHKTDILDSHNKVDYFLTGYNQNCLRQLSWKTLEKFIRSILFERTPGIRSVYNSL